MNKNDYIKSVICRIKSDSARQDIKFEISSHIDDRTQYYVDCGMDSQSALQKALERMGDPESVAEKFENLYLNPKYRILSYIFMVFYTVGLIAGLVLCLCCLTYTVDISDTMSACGLCFGSVMVFICSVLSLIFALKSKEAIPLRILGTVSIVGAFASPVTLVPCGFTILSLFFDFIPDLLSGEEFKYFYYAFYNIDGFDILVYVLYILMFLFGAFAIVTGLLSFKFSKDYTNSVTLTRKNRSIAKFYAIILIVLSSIAVFNFSIESLITTNQYVSNTITINHDIDEAIYVFDSIELPFNKEKFLYDFPECSIKSAIYDENVLEVYTNTVCTIYIKDGNCTKELANLESIGEKRCYSENEIRNLNSQVKNGISIDEFFTFFDKNKVAVYAVSLEDGKENTKIEFSSKELPFTAYYSFENDRLVDRNLA